MGPRRALAGLLNLGVDDRPKVRKRAQEAVTKVLKTAPPSPSLDHPAAEMCAIAVLGSVVDLSKKATSGQHDPRLIHAIQLMHAVAAGGGWPSSKVEGLVEVLLNISRSSNEFLTMAAFNVFEAIFESLLDEVASAKLPRIIEVSFHIFTGILNNFVVLTYARCRLYQNYGPHKLTPNFFPHGLLLSLEATASMQLSPHLPPSTSYPMSTPRSVPSSSHPRTISAHPPRNASFR